MRTPALEASVDVADGGDEDADAAAAVVEGLAACTRRRPCLAVSVKIGIELDD